MLAVVAEAQGQALQRRMLGRPVGLTVDTDGAEDPATRRFGGLLAGGLRRSLLGRLGKEQRDSEQQATQGTQGGAHGDAASKALPSVVATPEAYFLRFSRSSTPGRMYLPSLPRGLMRRSLSWRFLVARS